MIQRIQKLSSKNSCFLFGARGTGKTTLLKQMFSKKKTLWIDLLSYQEEDRFESNPDLLTELLAQKSFNRVIIDEVQKVPKLLDIVHLEIEKKKKVQFILTGSSSRKLKRGGANLLAGRLFTFNLHPLTHRELKNQFCLSDVLQTGSLPSVMSYKKLTEKTHYLDSYVQTYLKEEIQQEQIIRRVQPFKRFLEISAQCNGHILNYSKIAKDVGVDYTTVQNYFNILSDTYLGFYLYSFNRSIRKQIHQAPKFFLFDIGVQRTLLRKAQIPLEPKSYEYGLAFEHFVILELFRLNAYYTARFNFSYLRDKNGREVDIIIQKPSGEEILIEIKSTTRTQKEDGKVLEKFLEIWDRPCQAQVWSNDPKNRKINSIVHYHWKTALTKIFQ